jgi:hypothetical protein
MRVETGMSTVAARAMLIDAAAKNGLNIEWQGDKFHGTCWTMSLSGEVSDGFVDAEFKGFGSTKAEAAIAAYVKEHLNK